VKKSPASSLVRSARGPRARIAGFTLIEVMVALIVLVLGVLGAAAMTLTAIRDSKQSSLRSQASALAYELSDLMRMSPGQQGIFTGAVPSAVPSCWTTGCSPADMAKNNYYEWNAKLTGANGLPNGAAIICRDVANLGSDAPSYAAACDGLATSPLVVKLRWDEKNNNARDAASPTAVQPAYLVVPIQPY
jgi:type IV pilus assembly protein PilV